MKHKRITQNDHIERINEVLYRIHADLSQNLSVETLATLVAMSPFHFNRI